MPEQLAFFALGAMSAAFVFWLGWFYYRREAFQAVIDDMVEFQNEAVKGGHATWMTDENGDVDFYWLEKDKEEEEGWDGDWK